jgi:hypothetical protein
VICCASPGGQTYLEQMTEQSQGKQLPAQASARPSCHNIKALILFVLCFVFQPIGDRSVAASVNSSTRSTPMTTTPSSSQSSLPGGPARLRYTPSLETSHHNGHSGATGLDDTDGLPANGSSPRHASTSDKPKAAGSFPFSKL